MAAGEKQPPGGSRRPPPAVTCCPAWPCTRPGGTPRRTAAAAPPRSPAFPAGQTGPGVSRLWDPGQAVHVAPAEDGARSPKPWVQMWPLTGSMRLFNRFQEHQALRYRCALECLHWGLVLACTARSARLHCPRPSHPHRALAQPWALRSDPTGAYLSPSQHARAGRPVSAHATPTEKLRQAGEATGPGLVLTMGMRLRLRTARRRRLMRWKHSLGV